MRSRTAYYLFVFLGMCTTAAAQEDTTVQRGVPVDSLPAVAAPVSNQSRVDSVLMHHSPRKAAFRSAVLPGWGQVYNKKYWKLPIVYGALGVSAGVFIYNLKNYRDLRLAYTGKYEARVNGDSTKYWMIKSYLLPLDEQALRSYRNEFRRNLDYSALVFILLWGLNVVDATVDAHLKTFDVSPDLSLHIRPGTSELAGTTGLSFVLAIK